ncbi:MAG: type II toxin-antitoxin system VapC family toxin [Terrimicrobiaceae bacterium]|jgi:PIN domain nuclease of toxin-antitoxin system
MNYLLDTHVFLWMLSAPERLSKKAQAVIQNPDRTVYVSAVTSVEIAIKTTIGKLEAPESLWSEIPARGLRELPLRYVHGERLRALPFHHSDPFDRMLIAQAEAEDLMIITHDKKFDAYQAKVLWT